MEAPGCRKKHIDTLCGLLGVAHQKPKQTPFPTGGTLPLWVQTTALDPERSAVYRRCVGILLYVASDMPHAQFAIKTLASFSSSPNEGAWKCLRHLGNYLFHHRYVPSLQTEGKGHGLVVRSQDHVLEIFADSDWQGNKATRKSTSAGCILFNGMTIHCFSRSQNCVALSSAEAEYIACVSATCDGILLKAALSHVLHERVEVHLFTDSSAARGLMNRRGVGKLRHISGRLMWLQDFINKNHEATMRAIPTLTSPADLMTKSLASQRINCLCFSLGMRNEDEGFELVGSEEHEQQRQRDEAKKFLRAIRRGGHSHGNTLQVMALLLQLVGTGATDDQEHTLGQPRSESLPSDARLPNRRAVTLILLITIFAIAVATCLTHPDHPRVLGFKSLLSTLVGWFLSWGRARENEGSPLGDEAESEPESMPNLVDLDFSDADDAGSGDLYAYHSPRSVEEILGATPPLSRDSDPSEQPDEEPGDADDADAAYAPNPADAIARNQQPIACGQPVRVDQAVPLQWRGDSFVYIAPTSGRRYHIARDCQGLLSARMVQQITIDNMRRLYPGRLNLCYYCRLMLQHVMRNGTFDRVEHMSENLRLQEPEPLDET